MVGKPPARAAELDRRVLLGRHPVIGHGNSDEGEITGSPMAKMHSPLIPERPVLVLPDDQIRRLLDGCAGNRF